MMDLFSTSTVPGLIGFLLEIAIKGTLILAVAGLMASLLKMVSAAVRHLIWSTALVLILVLPVFVAIAPTYELEVLPPEMDLSTMQSQEAAVPVAKQVFEIPAPADIPTHQSVDQATALSSATTSADRSVLNARQVSAVPVTGTPFDWQHALFLLWGLGAGLVAFRYLLGWAALRRIRRHAVPVADVGLRLLVKRTASGIGLKRRVSIVWGQSGAMPLTYGWYRPTVLLPEDAKFWEPSRLIVVLQHELAHVKRHDCLIQALVYLACTIYWFNPLVWIAASQSYREREMACDDYVLSTGARGTDYAGHLLEIAKSMQGQKLSGVNTIAMARRSELEGRLMAILSNNRKRGTASRRGALGTFALVGCLGMSIAALRPVAIQNDTADATETDPAPVSEVTPVTDPPPSAVRAPEPELVATSQIRASAESESTQYLVEASAAVDEATNVVERSLAQVLPASVELTGEIAGTIGDAINLLADIGMELAKKDTIPIEQIMRLRSAGVDAEYIESMASLGFRGLTIDQLVTLAHADVDAEYVQSFRSAGFTDLTPDDLVALAFAGVDADDVSIWAELGYDKLTVPELIRFAHADVDAAYVRELADLGFGQLGPSKLVELGHADVDADFIRSMQAIGFGNISTDDLIQLSHAGVDEDFVAEMGKLGFDALSVPDVVKLSHAGIDGRFIREMKESGYTNLSADELIQLGFAGVDPEYIAELSRAGITGLKPDELVQLSHADIDAELIAAFSRAGLGGLSTGDLIQLGFADVDPDYMASMASVGLTDLTVSDLTMLGFADVEAEDVERLRALGFTTTDPQEIVRLHHMDIDEEYVKSIRRSLKSNK